MRPNKDVTFREAKFQDYEQICDLISNADELYYMSPFGGYTFPLTVDQIQNKMLKKRKDLTVMIEKNAEDHVQEEKVIAFANLYNVEHSKYAFIGNVIVDSGQRGRGIGRQLLLHMIGKAQQKYHLSEIRISVLSDNTNALLLYSKLKFVPYQVDEGHGLKGRVASIHLKRAFDDG